MKVKEKWDRASRLYDIINLPMEIMVGRKWRRMLFSQIPEGRILEIGIGAGVNIEFYPQENREYVGIDISTGMLKRAEERAKKRGINLTLFEMDAENLDFSPNTFDCMISTCVFCSVPDPVKGLKEAHRVLKPEGIAFLLEHMRPDGKFMGSLFDFLNRFTVKLGGVNINRRTSENIRKANFEIVEEKFLFSDIFRLIKARPVKK